MSIDNPFEDSPDTGNSGEEEELPWEDEPAEPTGEQEEFSIEGAYLRELYNAASLEELRGFINSDVFEKYYMYIRQGLENMPSLEDVRDALLFKIDGATPLLDIPQRLDLLVDKIEAFKQNEDSNE